MSKRLPIRRSFAAQVSRFAGVICIPVLIIGSLLHRGGYIDTPTLYPVLVVGFVLALIAVLTAVAGLATIWEYGGFGTSDAMRGLIFGSIALAPALLAAAAILLYPQLNDVSTDIDDPPSLRRPLGIQVAGHAQIADYSAQRQSYPDIVPRRFPLGTAELYAAAKQVVEARGWQVLGELQPAMSDDSAEIRVETHSLLIGFIDDMVIRIRPDRIGSRLDLRSVSRHGMHDLGANARRIRSFLASLDAVLTEAYGTLEPPELDAAPEEPEQIEPPEIPTPLIKPESISG